MSTQLESFLNRHNACPEGRLYAQTLAKLGIVTPDDVWNYIALPHHYRLWMFSKLVQPQVFLEFTLKCINGKGLSTSPQAERIAAALTNQQHVGIPEAAWLCNEVTRLAWVGTYTGLAHNPEYLKATRTAQYAQLTKSEQHMVGVALCQKALVAVQLFQAAEMFKVIPEIK